MAHTTQLPCDSDGLCMACKVAPIAEEKLTCKTCVTEWHVACLSSPPMTMAETLQWECPDCSMSPSDFPTVVVGKALLDGASDGSSELMAAIRAIEFDASLTEVEKAKKRQRLLSGKVEVEEQEDNDGAKKKEGKAKDILDIFNESLNCSFCIQLPERPVTTPCGHNFCLKCFRKWVGQGKNTCVKCCRTIPPKIASQPRINSALVMAIRMAKLSKNSVVGETSRVHHFQHNEDRPEKAYTTERARRKGKANAASGKIFVTVPRDHFGPIPAENDPLRNQGILVGECWEDRLECRQWGAHFPHVSGIAGQSHHGAQSVVLSGGYLDDEDHGEWFLYTGSGGRDLSGNRRTNNKQSFDQKFENSNLALKLSCLKGYPVRVIRSHKEKRSSYAPENGLRYDGVYRIEKCWQKQGSQGFKVCRYLFVRCDNEPAPWTSDDHGDRPRPQPIIPELENAVALTERKETPSWDFDEEDSCWKWKKSPPHSRKQVKCIDHMEIERPRKEIRKHKNISIREKLLRGFSCYICKKVMVSPVTTSCAHNFCKSCLEGTFEGQDFVRERSRGGRSLRSQKNVMKCPACPMDISDFLQNLQINRELMGVIESLKVEDEQNEEDSMDLSEEDAKEAEVDCTETDVGKDEEVEQKNEEKENSIEKLNESAGDSDVKEIQSKELLQVTKEVTNPVEMGTAKRKRTDDTKELSPEVDHKSLKC